MKFRKKSIVIEAIQWTGENNQEILNFVKEPNGHYAVKINKMIIHTLERDHEADINDWIIKGVKGEFYPCKPDIFETTYEAV
jgi:hypothetical protein